MSGAVSGYVTGAVTISVIDGTASFIILTILGVPFAAPLAVVMGVMSLIPLVGATIGAVIVGLVTAFHDFPTDTIIWTIYAIAYQQIENNVIQPLVQRRTVQLHPFVVLVAVLCGATLLGVLGALVAIPVAASIKILLEDWWAYRRETKILAQPNPPPPHSSLRPQRPSRARRRRCRPPRGSLQRLQHCGGHAADAEQPRPDVGADHRTDLRHEDRWRGHDLLRLGYQAAGLPPRRLDVLDDPGVCAVVVALLGVVGEPPQRTCAGAHALDRGDLLVERQDRLDLERRAEPGRRCTDAAAPAQVLERVDGEPHLEVRARVPRGIAPPRPRRRRPAPRAPPPARSDRGHRRPSRSRSP